MNKTALIARIYTALAVASVLPAQARDENTNRTPVIYELFT